MKKKNIIDEDKLELLYKDKNTILHSQHKIELPVK